METSRDQNFYIWFYCWIHCESPNKQHIYCLVVLQNNEIEKKVTPRCKCNIRNTRQLAENKREGETWYIERQAGRAQNRVSNSFAMSDTNPISYSRKSFGRTIKWPSKMTSILIRFSDFWHAIKRIRCWTQSNFIHSLGSANNIANSPNFMLLCIMLYLGFG